MGQYVIAPSGWNESLANPFSGDGTYGPEWSCFRISDEMSDRIWNGGASLGLYVCTFGRGIADLESRLADFLRYEWSSGRKVILSFLPDIDAESVVTSALKQTPDGTTIRPRDPRWVVHSTDMGSWEMIRRCGELRSLSFLRDLGSIPRRKRMFEDEEPVEYVNYVMFSNRESLSPEYVVASKQKNVMALDPDVAYQPGVRLYFDGHAIIRDGLAVRDGLCVFKARDSMPLHPYLVAAIGVSDLDPTDQTSTWTPREFLSAANEHFAALR